VDEGNRPGALEGIRVLDLSRVAAGPFATMLLGDMGADVIKVERPFTGDDARAMDVNFKGGESGYFLGLNKNKRSIAIDLQSPEGVEEVKQLAAWADVVVENFRVGVADRLGVGYAALREVNPAIVYCSISGFGLTGIRRDKPSYDIIAQAMGGIMDITGEEGGAPSKCGAPIADLAAGAFAALAVVSALYHRALTGEGQYVDTSLIGSILALLSSYLPAQANGTDFRRVGSAHNTLAPYQAFAGSDDRWFIVAAGNDAFWRKLATLVKAPELADDDRFFTNADRSRRRKELATLLQQRFSKRTAEEWLAELDQVGVPACPIYSLDDVLADPEFREVGHLAEVDHPSVGRLPLVMAPLGFSATPVSLRRPPPRLDEHGAEVRSMLNELKARPQQEARENHTDG
jgi:crotonobetainyl-CoA:carnitine CoA-transferase CaiB-like acyl-CoA transferase